MEYILKSDAEINERWTYCVRPNLLLKSKSKSDDHYCKIIGDSFISTNDQTSNSEYEFEKEYIQIGLNNPREISMSLINTEASNLVKLHGSNVLNKLLSDNSSWF